MTDSEKLDAIFEMLGALATHITGKRMIVTFSKDNPPNSSPFTKLVESTPSNRIIWADLDGG